ncbi:hypothetical protein ACNHYB_04460 [Isoptericola jiangsuensis]|uniref:hypothetical protein n=1 Tax=Isoptericola jiangsuensis TaxID=548579 RepID=UPI003AAAEF3D
MTMSRGNPVPDDAVPEDAVPEDAGRPDDDVPPVRPRWRRLPTWAVLVVSATAWVVVGFGVDLLDLLTGADRSMPTSISRVSADALVGGAAGGLVAALGARRVPAAFAAAAGPLLAALVIAFLGAPALGFTSPSAGVALVLERAPLIATVPGLACGLLAALGPTVLRATALVVPIVLVQGMSPLLVPDLLVTTGDYRLVRVATNVHLFLTAALLGVALGCSVTRRWWTYAMWIVPLALVPVATALRIGVGTAGDLIRPGASFLADDPFELVRVAGEYTRAALSVGAAPPWPWFVSAVAVGALVAWWRRRPTGSRRTGSRTPDPGAGHSS